MSFRRLTKDEALLWLNDRIGKSVHVSVTQAYGDRSGDAAFGEGILRHWSEGNERIVASHRPHQEVDLSGLYVAGETHFNLTNLRPLEIWEDFGHRLRVCLSDKISLTVVEQQEIGESDE